MNPMSREQPPALVGSLHEQGVLLAGWLAERGVTTLEARVPGQPPVTMSARVTDLPGWIVRAGAGCPPGAGPKAGLWCAVLGLAWAIDAGGISRGYPPEAGGA